MAHINKSPIIRHFFEKGQPMVVEKNNVIVGNEDTPNGIYYIDSGYIKTYSISDTGDQYLHDILGHGDIFPILWAYLGSDPDKLYYETLNSSTVWRTSRDWFNRYVRLNLPLSYEMSLQLARQFSTYIDRVDNLEYKKAGERLAYFLLYVASRFGSFNEDEELVINAPLTHELIGNSVNLTRESVSRKIEQLKEQNIIIQNNHTISITDLEGLTSQISRPVNFDNWQLSTPGLRNATFM